MLGIAIPQPLQPYVALAIVAVMFILFLRETIGTEVVAMAGAAAMIVLGLLPVKEASGVLSNSAPWTIVFMFLIMGAMLRTGALEAMSSLAERRVNRIPARQSSGFSFLS